MSSARSDSNNTSDPAELRRSAESLQKQDFNVTASPTPATDDVPLKHLSKAGRSETAPITIPERLWSPSPSRDNPQLTERDTIFATHYVQSRSPPPSDSNTHNGILLANVEQSLGGASAGKVKASPRSSRRSIGQVTFADDPEYRRIERTRSHPYEPEVHELLRDSPISGTPDQTTPMGVDWKQADFSRRPHHSLAQRPSTSPRYNLDHVDEAERLRYRSWREGNAPVTGWSAAMKRRSRSGDNTHVDKNIEATLPSFDPPVTSHRSRKASQYLGLFKENDVAEQQKKRDQQAKERADTSREQQELDEISQDFGTETSQMTAEPEDLNTPDIGTYDALGHGGPQLRSDLPAGLPRSDLPARLPRYNTDLPVDTGKRANATPIPLQKPPQSLSSRLVEEMKHRHDIELSSDSERLLSRSFPAKRVDRSRLPSPKVRTPTDEYAEYLTRHESDESAGKSPFTDEEDTSEHEQISKALYYPHRQIITADEEQYERDTSSGNTPHAIDKPQTSEEPLPSSTEQQLMEAVEISPNEVALSIETADDKEYFHGDLPPSLASPVDEDSYSSSHDLTYSGSEYETQYDSSSSDEAGETPKASPKHRPVRDHGHYHPSAPVGAVELKPYDHQVGGHSTVYRFSRRAVCKQLNNRENIFYETVERRHPELLGFMPRYIGVLNVTYRKALKRRKTANTTPLEPTSPGIAANADDKENVNLAAAEPHEPNPQITQPRIVSHSQQITPVPQVVLENNRHIIPNSLFRPSSRPNTPRPQSSDPSLISQMHRRHQSEDNYSQPSSHSADTSPSRPAFKQHDSWGATTVNTRLKEQVLREVFSSPPIHRHRRGRRQRAMSGNQHAHLDSSELATSGPAVSNGISDRTGMHSSFTEAESLRRQLLRGEAERYGLMRTTSAGGANLSPPQLPPAQMQDQDAVSDRASDESISGDLRKARRRHSGGGLLRRPFAIDSDKRSSLEFHEEEEGYRGDREDEVFVMEDDASVRSPESNRLSCSVNPSPETNRTQAVPIIAPSPEKRDQQTQTGEELFEPSNPKQAVVDKDERAQLFILLEDLTAGMSKPCVLDLKMGTRQYGIEADAKKKRSQRRKCQMTTSQELGVRVCGMQIFNTKTQSVVFKDKYFGRDLKAGREFQNALKNFFFDGYGYNAALKHIPTILEKISNLEAMIRQLPGYRFYASSLLMLYDSAAGDAASRVESSYMAENKKNNRKLAEELKKKAEIKLKIVDFANCVTAEDPAPPEASCPPHEPDDIDRGYLRGLRSLRLYFQRILKELSEAERVDRGEGDGTATEKDHEAGKHMKEYENPSMFSEDEGNVSL